MELEDLHFHIRATKQSKVDAIGLAASAIEIQNTQPNNGCQVIM